MIRPAAVCCAAALALLLAAQDDPSEFAFTELAKGFAFTEGPAWSAKDGYLIFSDTPSDRLFRWEPGQKIEIYREDAHGPSGNAFDATGRLYTCETRTRRVTRTEKNGAITVVADKWEGKRFNAPNDITVSKTGHVYFTDPAFGEQSDHRELDFYGVYHVPLKGPMKLVAKPVGRPNGIAISPNGRVLYVVNTDERNVRAYDVDHNGDTSNERVLIAKIAGLPGGVTVDEKGNLFVTANGILIYTPDGRLIRKLEMHDRPSDCAFGEPDLKSLIITAGSIVYRSRINSLER
jgi:sugar lactone lactonase YvrE